MTTQRSQKLKLHVLSSKLHKWLALFIGVQALLWMGTGAIMAFLKIEHVRSEHVIARNSAPLPANTPIPRWLANRGDLISVTTRALNGSPTIEVKRQDGSASLHDPSTGRKLSPLPGEVAKAIAKRAWIGPRAGISSARSISGPVGTEFAGPFPAWQITFADSDGTRLYIDASTGAVLAARSDTWRFFDFVWGLHIMDWTQRDRINSWWLLVFGIGGTLMACSGFILLANRFPIRRQARTGRERSSWT